MTHRRSRLVVHGLAGIVWLTLLLVRTLAVSAAPVYGGHGVVLNYAYPEVWDPHIAGTLGAIAAIGPMYNQVVEFNPVRPEEVIGDLASRWEVSDGGATYLFYLHENVKWWDGTPLTAEDVAFSLKRMVESGKPRPRVGLLRPYIKSAEAIAPYTVQVTLHYPSPAFLQFLAVDYMKVVPKHVMEAGVDINVWENIVGSGPFKIKTARRGDAVTYERNPNYFKPGKPYLERLTIQTIGDKGTVAAAFRAGRVVMTTGSFSLDVEDVLRLAKELDGKYAVHWQLPNAVQQVFFNTEREPWKDPRVVRALWLATDRREQQQAFGAGHYTIGAPFPPDAWYGSPVATLLTLPGYRDPKTPDIEAARALLKEAGYDPPAKLGKRVIAVPSAIFYPDLAQLWAAQMRRNLGLDSEVKVLDTPSAVNSFVAGDYDVAVFGYGFNIDDPDDYVNAIYGAGSRNYTRWKHPRFLQMLQEQSRQVEAEKRLPILRQMEQFLLTQESPWIEVFWTRGFHFVSQKVRTEAGAFVPARTLQTILKHEHWWLEP